MLAVLHPSEEDQPDRHAEQIDPQLLKEAVALGGGANGFPVRVGHGRMVDGRAKTVRKP